MTKKITALMKGVASGLIGASLSSCAVTTVHEHGPVDAQMMLDLKAHPLGLKELGLQPATNAVRIAGGWDAPDSVTVPMSLRGGLPSIQCSINGGPPEWLIIDTGSQGCVLEAVTAVRNRVRVVDPSMTNLHIIGVLGAEPAMMGVPDRLEIGKWRIDRFPTLIRTQKNRLVSSWPFGGEDLAFDVLGTNAMAGMCSYVTLDYPKHTATFGFRKPFRPPHGPLAWHAPLGMEKGLLQVGLRSSGVAWSALIDTGATSAAELNEPTAKRLGLLKSARTVTGARFGVGNTAAGVSDSHQMVTIPDIEQLGPAIRRVPALVVGDFTKIGTGLLRRFRVTFDFRGHRLWLEEPR